MERLCRSTTEPSVNLALLIFLYKYKQIIASLPKNRKYSIESNLYNLI